MADFQRIYESFDKQAFMQFIGAKLSKVELGKVDVEVQHNDNLTQQNGYLHAGVVTTLLDVACGYAANSMMTADQDVLSVEFKTNLLRPSIGEKYIAKAEVVKPGKKLIICTAQLFNEQEDKILAIMTATMICM